MSVYTVHEPPLRATDSAPDPERFVFVRDGFSIWAFLFSVLWMLWYRLWLALLAYLVVVAGMEAALRYAGVSSVLIGILGVLASLLIGIEAGTLRRFKLSRIGFRNIGVVCGSNLDDAERRFFDAWVRAGEQKRAEPPAASPGLPPTPPPPPSPPSGTHSPQQSEVIGLFPEPGVSR